MKVRKIQTQVTIHTVQQLWIRATFKIFSISVRITTDIQISFFSIQLQSPWLPLNTEHFQNKNSVWSGFKLVSTLRYKLLSIKHLMKWKSPPGNPPRKHVASHVVFVWKAAMQRLQRGGEFSAHALHNSWRTWNKDGSKWATMLHDSSVFL